MAKDEVKLVLTHTDTRTINKRIRAILKRGNTVCFRNKTTGKIKLVVDWVLDESFGDLVAEYSEGTVKFVCPYAVGYEITELKGRITTKEDYDKAVPLATPGS
jgi:hypothetical protein